MQAWQERLGRMSLHGGIGVRAIEPTFSQSFDDIDVPATVGAPPVDDQLTVRCEPDLAQTGGLLAALTREQNLLIHNAMGGPGLLGRNEEVTLIQWECGTAADIMTPTSRFSTGLRVPAEFQDFSRDSLHDPRLSQFLDWNVEPGCVHHALALELDPNAEGPSAREN